jgi:hypothetical protein
MPTINPPAVPTLPAAPDPANRSTFNNLAYAWSTALGPFSTGLQALAVNVKANADDAAASASSAGVSAASAINAPGTSATSTTSLTLSTGSKTLTIQTGKAFAVGQFVVLASAANVANYMHGQIAAHNTGTGTLTVNVGTFTGTGTFADWLVALTAPGNITLDGVQTLTNKVFKNTGVGYFDAGDTASLSFVNASHQRWAPTGTKTLTITNWLPAGNLSQMMIEGTNLGVATITWPTINWINSDGTTTTAIGTYLAQIGRTLRTSGTDWCMVWTRDGGTTLYGKLI